MGQNAQNVINLPSYTYKHKIQTTEPQPPTCICVRVNRSEWVPLLANFLIQVCKDKRLSK